LFSVSSPIPTWGKHKKPGNGAVCSVTQVYVRNAEMEQGQFNWAVKQALDRSTAFQVPDVNTPEPKSPPPGTAFAEFKESWRTGWQSSSNSSLSGSLGESGHRVKYELRIVDERGNVLWSGEDDRELEGVRSSADEYSAEAHEVHASPANAVRRLAWRLNREAHCGNWPKHK
jgi:hypothetical protein